MKALTVDGDASVEILQPGGRITVAVPEDITPSGGGGTCHSFANATTNDFPGTDEDTSYHGSTGAAFEALFQGDGWTFTAAGSVWTYNGAETRTVRITVTATPDVDGTPGAFGFYLAVAINNDIIGTDVTAVFDHGAGLCFPDFSSTTMALTADYVFTVSPGDTVRPVAGTRSFGGAPGALMRVARLQMTIVTA